MLAKFCYTRSMKNAQEAWEQEYAAKRLMTGEKPASSVIDWTKKLIKSRGLRGKLFPLEDLRVLDLGSGEGKNAFYLAELGAEVHGLEIARNAVETANQKLVDADLVWPSEKVTFTQGSIGKNYNFPDAYFDLIIDVTSTNSLSEAEREVHLTESSRVLNKDGQMFVRTLCKDGDKNAKHLLKSNPGKEHDTYVQPRWGLVERVFSEPDLRHVYQEFFQIDALTKETHYTTMDEIKYRRLFWVLHLTKK